MAEPLSSRVGHFQDLSTQRRAGELGTFVFLGSETLLFGALLALYTALRVSHGDAFVSAMRHNDMALGTSMTAVLLTSSFLVAWAVRAVRLGRAKQSVLSLLATIALAILFLALKLHEYQGHIAEGILPGAAYASDALPQKGARMFFTMYYALTALHALHVLVGVVGLAWMALWLIRRKLDERHSLPLELVGLYWHMVDIVWIFLWPLLYRAT